MDAEGQAKTGMGMDLGASLGSQFMAYVLPRRYSTRSQRDRVTFDALLCGVILCQCLRWLPDFRTDMMLIRTAVVSLIAWST